MAGQLGIGLSWRGKSIAPAYVTPEDFGAVGQAGTNDQPAIQAAIDFAAAAGIAEVRFPKPLYEVWCPERTTHAADKFEPSGHPLVVQASLVMRGVAASITTIALKASDGSDRESNWQTVETSGSDSADAVWRGGGLLLLGDQADPGDDFAIDRFELRRILLDGGCTRTGDHSYPADTGDGDGWDLTDKGFWVQDTYVGDIVLRDAGFIGFKGEIFYIGGYAPRSVNVLRGKFLTTNASALSFGCDDYLFESCEFGEAYQTGVDGTLGYQGSFLNCLFRDSTYFGIGVGNIASLLGYPYAFPSRDETIQPPLAQLIGCKLRNCGNANFGSWVYAPDLKITDTSISSGTANTYGWRDCFVSAHCVQDQVGSLGHSFGGPASLTTAVPGAPGGTYVIPPTNIRFKISCSRTDVAIANGREWQEPYWQGYFDPSCRFEFDGAEWQNETMRCFDSPPKSFPFISHRNMTNSSTGTGSPLRALQAAITADGELVPLSPILGITCSMNVDHELTLAVKPDGAGGGPADTYGYAQGQRLKIYKSDNTGTLTFTRAGIGTYIVPIDRVLDNKNDWIEFEWNRWASRWEETGFFTSV